MSVNEITPPCFTRVNFEAATAFVRKYVIGKKPVALTSRDRGFRVTLDAGWNSKKIEMVYGVVWRDEERDGYLEKTMTKNSEEYFDERG